MAWPDITYDLTILGSHWAEVIGYLGAFLVIAANSRATMIPLRVFGISANCCNVIYGIFAHVYPPLVLHAVLLPLNVMRLYQMLQLIKKVNTASKGDLSMNWLKPFMTKRAVKTGEIIFSKGDLAADMYFTVTGRFRLKETGSDVIPGEIIGELGLVNPDKRRTLTFQCVENGELLVISYAQVKQLYYQNPKFGFYFLELIGQRLFCDIERLEAKLDTRA